MYYSNISQSIVSEEEAHLQIIQICERWFHLAHPDGNFEKYFVKHSDLFLIKRWSCFEKISESNDLLPKFILPEIGAAAI